MTNTEFFGEIKPKNEYSSSTMTIIMGHPGVGKTVLACTASELGFTILFNFENRIAHIEETENLRIIPRSVSEFREDRICTYEAFKGFISDILLTKKVRAVYCVIDTLDSMFDVFLKHHISFFKDKRAAYGAAYDDMAESLKLLKESGSNIIMPSHVVNDVVLDKITIGVNEKLRNKINNIVDNTFFLDIIDDETRVLRLKTDAKVKCKLTTQSTEKYNKVAQEIVNPDWKTIMETIS